MDTLRENDLFETVSGFSIPRPDQLSLTKTVLISSHNVTTTPCQLQPVICLGQLFFDLIRKRGSRIGQSNLGIRAERLRGKRLR